MVTAAVAAADALVHADADADADRADDDPAQWPDEVVERKFRDTLEEVLALKCLLEDCLEDRPQSPPRPGPPTATAARVTTTRQVPRGHEDSNQREDPSPPFRTSKGSERLLQRSLLFEPNFQARMRFYMARNQQRRDQIRREAEARAHEELTARPSINPRSKRIARSVDHLLAWNDDKTHKLSRLRTHAEQRAQAEVIAIPTISRRSRTLFTQRRDDLARCRVEDRLHLLGLIYEYQLEEQAVQHAQETAAHVNRPLRLAPHTRQLQNRQPGAIHDQLYAMAQERRRPDSDATTIAAHGANGHTRTSAEIASAVERLTRFGAVYREKREAMARQREQQLRDAQMAPKLSSHSRELVAARRETPVPAHPQRRCPCCEQGPSPSSSPGTRRRIDGPAASKIYAKHLRWHEERQQRTEALRQRLEEELQRACTFRPAASHAWRDPEDAEWWGADGVDPRPIRPRPLSPRPRRLRRTTPIPMLGLDDTSIIASEDVLLEV